MSATEAKQKIKEFNKMNKGSKIEVARQARAFQRYKQSITINQTLFPPEMVALFKQKMTNENFGSAKHLEKKEYVFNIAQAIINQLGYTPEIYNENSKTIYKILSKRKYSVNYCQKIISILNEWGKFATSKGSGYYKNITIPRGSYPDEIQKQSTNKSGVRKEALPMTQVLLDQISNIGLTQGILGQKQINALKAMFYFGLRPPNLPVMAIEGQRSRDR